MKEYYALYKYFKGEEISPFDSVNERAKDLFWYIESVYYQNSLRNENLQKNLLKDLEDYLKQNPNEKNFLTNITIPKEKRALILYIDLMIGKWCPTEGDLIFEY